MKNENIYKSLENLSIAVVIPAFKVSKQILDTINLIGPEVDHIVVVDDLCPESSGELVRTKS